MSRPVENFERLEGIREEEVVAIGTLVLGMATAHVVFHEMEVGGGSKEESGGRVTLGRELVNHYLLSAWSLKRIDAGLELASMVVSARWSNPSLLWELHWSWREYILLLVDRGTVVEGQGWVCVPRSWVGSGKYGGERKAVSARVYILSMEQGG